MAIDDESRPDPVSETDPHDSQAGTPRRPGWLTRHWVALLLGLVCGVLLTYVWAQYDRDAHVAAAQSELIQARRTLETELRDLRTRTDNLQGQLLIEQGTRQGLESALKTVQAELAQAHEKVAFFDQLLPLGPGGTISVRGLDIAPQDAILSYKVLLTRQAPPNGPPFEGRLVFEATGKQGGKALTVPLEFLADAKAEDGPSEREVSFEWFFRQEGYLKLPVGFTPTSLMLRVYEGKTLRLSHSVDLPLAP